MRYNVDAMIRPFALLLAGFGIAALAFAQPATPAQRAGVPEDPNFGTMHFQANLGSFRVIDAVGRLEVRFTGTLLVSRLEGTIRFPEGRIVPQYRDRGREVYHGTGVAVITGRWRAVQWFGRDMRAVFYGRGLVRLFGEFDAQGNLGTFWYDDPARFQYWPAGTAFDYPVPERRPTGTAAPRPRQ